MGQSIVNFIANLDDINKITEAFYRIKKVKSYKNMTKKDIALVNKVYTEQNIKVPEWNCINGEYVRSEKSPKEFLIGDKYDEALVPVQGNLAIYTETDFNIMFKQNPFEEEYAYILNLDTNCLDVYSDYRDPITQKVDFGC